MAPQLTANKPPKPLALGVTGPAQIQRAAGAARTFASALGFAPAECEQIALAVTELASNLLKHAGGGLLQFNPLEDAGHAGIEIVSEDSGPGIPDVERALANGYSTAGSLGDGLGAVNRLMDDLVFYPRPEVGLRIVCQRWVRPPKANLASRWLEFGAATRPCRLVAENGDAIVIRQWEGGALAGVIDGLGHGQFAQRASQTARHYLEQHCDQPLENLFRGVGRACRATRGVVMALAQFDLARQKVAVANVGNIEVRLLDSPGPCKPIVRRGILGLNTAPNPVPTEHPWTAACLLVLHSDGVRTHWQDDEARELSRQAPALIARHLLDRHGRLEDDATVLVARSTKP